MKCPNCGWDHSQVSVPCIPAPQAPREAQAVPGFLRRRLERTIEETLHPVGMSVHDGIGRFAVADIQYLLAAIDRLSARPAPEGWVSVPHVLQSAEKDVSTLATHTPVHYAGDYPPFINLTMVRMKGDVVLTVRLPTIHGGPCGAVSSVRFDRELWRAFVALVTEANTKYEATDYLDAI